MAALVDLGALGKLIGQPRENPVSARRFRSTAITMNILDPQTPWSWEPQTSDGSEVALLAHVQSPVSLKAGGSATVATAGLFLHPHHRATVSSPERTTVLCAWVPWSALDELDRGDFASFAIAEPTPLLQGARAFAAAVTSHNSQSTIYTEYLIEKLVAEMAFGTLLEAGGSEAGTTRDAISRDVRPIERARTLMLLRRGDPTFGVEELARELHTSTRQLQRTFAAEGAPPAEELRRLRAELALELMRDPQYAPLTLRQIAEHSGFGTPASLRRAFATLGLELPRNR